MFICAYCFLGLELGCFICAYFPFSRFGIRLCSFVPIFHFLGLELGCVHLCLFPFSRFGIRLCSFVPIVFSVWN